MSNSLELKKTVVSGIKDKFDRAQCAVMIDYRGLTVAEDTALRNEFRKAGCEYAVLKNTMVRLAVAEKGYAKDMDPLLNGPTAIAFSYDDMVAPAKVIKTFIDKNKKLSIKCGVCDGAYLDVAGVNALADLPGKDVLIARIMGSMMSAVSSFVRLVEAIRKKQAGEE